VRPREKTGFLGCPFKSPDHAKRGARTEEFSAAVGVKRRLMAARMVCASSGSGALSGDTLFSSAFRTLYLSQSSGCGEAARAAREA